MAGVVLAIIALIKKLEPKKNVFIGGGLSLLIFILAWSGYRSIASDDSLDFSYSGTTSTYSYDSSNDNSDIDLLKAKAIDFAKRSYEAATKNDKGAIVKIMEEYDKYFYDLSESDQKVFQAYFDQHMEQLYASAATEVSTSDVEDAYNAGVDAANAAINSGVSAANAAINAGVSAANAAIEAGVSAAKNIYDDAWETANDSYKAAGAAIEAAAASAAAAISDSWDW